MFDKHFNAGRRASADMPRRDPHGHGFPGRGFGPGPGFGPGFGPMGGGFGPRGRSRARRGDVRLVLLALLGEKESNGYGLISSMGERTDGRWRPSPGSVYPTLQQLVDEGLVETRAAERGDAYALTDEGRAYVEQNAEAIQTAWGELPGGGEEDAFHTAFFKLMKAAKQFGSDATPEQRAQAAEEMDALRRSLYGKLAE